MKKAYMIGLILCMILLSISFVSAYILNADDIYFDFDDINNTINDSTDTYNFTHSSPAGNFQKGGLPDYSTYSIFLGGYLSSSVGLVTKFNEIINDTWETSIWVNATAASDFDYVYYFGASGDGFRCGVSDSGDIYYAVFRTTGTDKDLSTTGFDPDKARRHMLSVGWNTTHYYIFVNASSTLAWSVASTDRLEDTSLSFLRLGANPSGGETFSGQLDELMIFNYSLTYAQRTELFDYGITEAVEAIPSTPTIVAPSPENNANNNTNVTLNVTHPTVANDVNYYLYFGNSTPLTETDLYLNNATRTGDEFKQFTTNVSDGTYYWKWKVQNTSNGGFSGNTTERTLIIDTVTPTITLLSGNDFSSDNSTIISSYIKNLTINVSFFDIHLAGGQTLINITNETDGSVYSKLNTSITGTTVNVSEIIDIGGWQIGNYTIKLVATDSHTAKEILPYDVETGLNYFRYITPEGNIIKIESSTLPLTRKTTKLKDRYSFEFNYLLSQDTYKFRITSYNKINYLADSKYSAHFVIMGDNLRGNWLDFGGINKKDVIIKKIDDYEYEVKITSNGEKNFEFNSLGGLNTIEEHYLLRVGSVIDVWVWDEDTGQGLNATANIGVQFNSTVMNTTPATLHNITKDTTSITLNATGYGIETHGINLTTNYHNLSFNMTSVSAVKIYFYDENSEGLIEGETFTTYLETVGFSQIYSIATNPYIITGLGSGLYELKASSSNYPEREYRDLNVSNVTSVNLNIYMINETLGSEITFNVLDSNSEDIEDVSVDFYRTIAGTSTLMAQEQTDYGGKCRLYLDINYEYTINFSKTDYLTKTINLEPAAADSPYTIYLDDDTTIIPPLAVSYAIRNIFKDGITYNLTYTNLTRVVNFSWYDESSYVDNLCMKVYDINRSFYSSCSALNTGYLNYTITTLNRTYIAKAWAVKDGNDYTLKIININLMEVLAKLGKDIVVVSWIVFLTLSFIGLAKPYVSLFLGTFGLIGMFLIGMLPIGFGTIMGIISVAVIISIGIRRSRRQ